MGQHTESRGRVRRGIAEAAAVIVFVLGLACWYLGLDGITAFVQEWARGEDVGDAAIGMLIVGPVALGCSSVVLLLAIGLSFRAKRLPTWFRILTILSPVLGCLLSVAMIYRGLAH